METLYCARCDKEIAHVDGEYADLVVYCPECALVILEMMLNFNDNEDPLE